MTDARHVWDTWRRILRDDQLVAQVLDPAHPRPVGQDHETLAIIADYARTPEQSATNIGMYRRGLARNALGALALVPLSRHLLFMTDLDLDKVADEFAQSVGHVDYGPNFWKAAGAFIAYLATRPDFAAAPWQDVFAIDLATVALARRLGEAPPPVWPAAAPGSPAALGHPATQWSLAGAATLVETAHDLAAWIENPESFDPDEPVAATPSHWLVYFPAAELPRHYVQLSECAAAVVAGCARPATIEQLARSLSLDTERVAAILESLAGSGLMLPVATEQVVQSLAPGLADARA